MNCSVNIVFPYSIWYFSGTGNSAYAAKRIGTQLNDETLNLFEKIWTSDFSELPGPPMMTAEPGSPVSSTILHIKTAYRDAISSFKLLPSSSFQ